jgi:tRNA threonylcarbamoyladenosine biosynthesis protein TsaB
LTTFALDTSTRSPSFALVGESGVIAERLDATDPTAGRRVLEGMHQLLVATQVDLRDLDRIVVGVGPGGFTGLRIGIATALALGQGLGIEVVGAISLEALAHEVAATAPDMIIVPALDARRREVFAAVYRARPGGGLDTLLAPCALAPAIVRQRLREFTRAETAAVIVGDGAALIADDLSPAVGTMLDLDDSRHHPRAAALVARVDAGYGRPARPVYARLADAEVNRLNALHGVDV